MPTPQQEALARLIGPFGAEVYALSDYIDSRASNASMRVSLTSGKSAAGVALAAAAAGGAFGVSNTLGTSLALLSQVANASTVTDTVMFEFQLPATWDPASPMKLVVTGAYTLGAGTLGTDTLTAHAYILGGAGNYGADQFAGVAAQALPAELPASLTFTASALLFVPGSRVALSLVLVLQDTGASAITGKITEVRITQ